MVDKHIKVTQLDLTLPNIKKDIRIKHFADLHYCSSYDDSKLKIIKDNIGTITIYVAVRNAALLALVKPMPHCPSTDEPIWTVAITAAIFKRVDTDDLSYLTRSSRGFCFSKNNTKGNITVAPTPYLTAI